MKRVFLVLFTAVIVLPCLTAARVQADMIQWSASGTPLIGNVPSTFGSAQIYGNAGGGVVSFLSGPLTSGTNSGSIVALNVSYAENPNGSAIPQFSGPSADYSLSITVHDAASGTFGSLIFHGNLSGEIDQGNHFWNTYIGPTTQTLKLGQDLYTVTMGPYVNGTELGPWGGGTYGTISANISVQPVTNATPEPSSLLLACLAVPPLGLARWLRRRKTGPLPTTPEPKTAGLQQGDSHARRS